MAKKTSRSAKSSAKQSAKTAKGSDSQEEIRWPFGPKNYLVFALALVVIVIGYVTLGYGSMTLAPILLVLGYCVLIPVAIVVRGKAEDSPSTAEKATSDSPSQ
jgi:hypothetical protein